MNIRIKKTHPNSIIPKYAHKTDACFDLYSVDRVFVDNKDHGYIEYDLGIQIELPKDYCALIFPRSSISNTGLILSNAVGVIDESYRGTIKARFKWIKDTKIYEIGERCCQMMIIPTIKVNFEEFEGEWESTERNCNGFGSTNK